MTRTHYQELSLAKVVQRSRLILRVKKEEPFQVQVAVPIHKDTEKYPPYNKTVLRFKVLEVLYDRYEKGGVSIKGEMKVAPGSVIETVDHEFDTMFHCHKLYYLEHIGKSPLIERYSSSADLEKEPELLLFISKIGEKELSFLGYDSLSKKDEVLKMIEAKNQPL